MSTISTHILDTSRGVAAARVHVMLERETSKEEWAALADAFTDADGRVKALVAPGSVVPGTYRLTFETGAYWESLGLACFHPLVEVLFTITDASKHHHVPLLVSPFGYSTYRGT